jgi:H+-transporting ATPase
MIAYDNARVSPLPVRWVMHQVLSLSAVLGVMGVIASFGLFWLGRDFFHLAPDTLRTVIFLKLLVAGHLTIYLTRNAGAIWDHPWPNWRLIVFTETTQIIGTLAAVYGWFVTPIGWGYALAVWGYALVWFMVNSGVKIATHRLLERGMKSHQRHFQRVTQPLHPAASR